jgi:hypothetical protein
MISIHLTGRKFFRKETVRLLLLLVANWGLLFWSIIAAGRYLVGTEPGFFKAVFPLSLLTWVMGYRFRKRFLARGLVVASLGLAGVLVCLLKLTVDSHAGPGAGILFVPFLLGLAACFLWDLWGVLKRANQPSHID